MYRAEIKSQGQETEFGLRENVQAWDLKHNLTRQIVRDDWHIQVQGRARWLSSSLGFFSAWEAYGDVAVTSTDQPRFTKVVPVRPT